MKKLYKYIYLLLAAGCLLLVFMFDKTNLTVEYYYPDTQTFTVNLHEKEHMAERWLDTLLNGSVNADYEEIFKRNADKFDVLYENYGLVLYVYKGKNLAYWTNNVLNLPADTAWAKPGFAQVGNAYVEVVKKYATAKNTLVACIVIKTNYDYENEFIKNRFHHSFSELRNFELTNTPNNQTDIYSRSGSYMFTIVPFTNSQNPNIALLGVFLIVLGLFFFLIFLQHLFPNKRLNWWQYIVFSVLAAGVWFGFQTIGWPLGISQLSLFMPQLFAASVLFPSLGHLLIVTMLAFYLVYVFHEKVKINLPHRKFTKYLGLIIWYLLVSGFAYISFWIFARLVTDSTFQFEAYDFLNLTVFSFVGYFILILWFSGLIILIDKSALWFKHVFKSRFIISLFVLLCTAFTVILYLFDYHVDIVSIIFLIIIFWWWQVLRYKSVPGLTSLVVFVALFSAYATYFIRVKSFDKRVEQSKIIAINLAREQDPVAEVLLSDFIADVKHDTVVLDILTRDWLDYETLFGYIEKQYFSGYLQRYQFQLTLCNRYDSVWVNEDNRAYQCYSFFRRLINSKGVETNVKGLYLMRNNMGRVNYFLRLPFVFKQRFYNITLFFELVARPNVEVLGYPELLLEKPITPYGVPEAQNYAKYNQNRLVSYSGDFPYSFNRETYNLTQNEFSFFRADGYDHIVFNAPSSDTVIISHPTVDGFNILISFTYIYLFFLIMLSLLLAFGNRYFRMINVQLTIKNKIVTLMITILFVSLILVGGGTVIYTYLQFDKNQMNSLADKTRSVQIELEQNLGTISSIDQISENYIDNLLIRFSNIYFTDINIYDLNGKMKGTSRKEIFDRKLTGNQINATAFRELLINKRSRIVHKENIGKLEYYSAYIPLVNQKNQLLAYLNLPYFSKENLLRKELLQVLVAVINIYAVLVILSVMVAVYISNRFTRPLRQIQQRIKNIDLNKTIERIDYTGHDEVAELVLEYNRMSDALAESARLLAKSERESAWREMAKQVAHEIKNPLTPMKLSVQLLERSWVNNDTNFEQRLKNVTQTLIEQIDSLSNIASAFSKFAQMPASRTEKVNLNQRIINSIELFKECANAKITFANSNQVVFVKGDNERLLQVFNNLIKNAIQAIPPKRNGQINIEIKTINKRAIVSVCDNGIGVPNHLHEKLFQPNFTTKNSGTGLGLAIVKNIVEELEGKVWFTSNKKIGSTFFIELPVF